MGAPRSGLCKAGRLSSVYPSRDSLVPRCSKQTPSFYHFLFLLIKMCFSSSVPHPGNEEERPLLSDPSLKAVRVPSVGAAAWAVLPVEAERGTSLVIGTPAQKPLFLGTAPARGAPLYPLLPAALKELPAPSGSLFLKNLSSFPWAEAKGHREQWKGSVTAAVSGAESVHRETRNTGWLCLSGDRQFPRGPW